MGFGSSTGRGILGVGKLCCSCHIMATTKEFNCCCRQGGRAYNVFSWVCSPNHQSLFRGTFSLSSYDCSTLYTPYVSFIYTSHLSSSISHNLDFLTYSIANYNSIANYTHLTALCPGLPRRAGTRKVKPIWILLKQGTVSGKGISLAICMFAPHSRQITTPAPHRSVF